MEIKETLSEEQKTGYVIRKEFLRFFEDDDIEMLSAYTDSGDYIGSPSDAEFLCVEKRIKPELRPDTKVCSIGFCESEQKWYGWSHRARHGFSIGSKVIKGDCGYVPVDLEDARRKAVEFWSDEDKSHIIAIDAEDSDGKFVFNVSWRLLGDCNDSMQSSYYYPPESYGQGEWEAKTLGDAKKMASDFAEGVG